MGAEFRNGRTRIVSVIAAYAGEEAAAVELVPALSALRSRCRTAAVTLLWPAGAARHGELAILTDSTIEYPTSRTVPVARAARAAARTVSALRDTAADLALVFSAEGVSAHGPAYLCYLAGIRRRVGYSREFSGGVLSEALPPPSGPRGSDRHLALLTALERRS